MARARRPPSRPSSVFCGPMAAMSAFLDASPKRPARAKLGFLPERASLSEHRAGCELVTAHGLLAGLSGYDARTRAVKLLERMGLAAAAHRRFKSSSKRMLPRVGIAQALVSE